MNNFLYYDTSIDQYKDYYKDISLPFERGKEIITQAQKGVVFIRTAAMLALTSLASLILKNSILFWPVTFIGTAFAARTIFLNLLIKDPLLEIFYKIIGGKDKFKELPELDLKEQNVYQAIKSLKWEVHNHKIYRSETIDGRIIFIVNGLSRDQGTKSIFAFVEKFNSKDSSKEESKFEDFTNIYSAGAYYRHNEHAWGISGSITSDMANEFFAQLQE